MNQETLKKYGVWIAVGAVALYLVYRNLRGGAGAPRLLPSSAGGVSSEQFRLESERLRQAGALDLERERLNASVEAARRKADLDRFNLEQQNAARNRLLDAQRQAQQLGLIGQLINSLANLFKGQQSKPSGGGGVGGGTPPTFPGQPRTQLPAPPYYSIPAPSINVLYDPSYQPDYPAPPEYLPLRVDDWGEPPAFQTSGLDLDSGASFNDQVYGADFGGDFFYGYGADYGGDLYSGEPDYARHGYYYLAAGDDFVYGYGQGASDEVEASGDFYYPDAGDDFVYGYGAG